MFTLLRISNLELDIGFSSINVKGMVEVFFQFANGKVMIYEKVSTK